MGMHGFACLKTNQEENTIGLNTKTVKFSERRINVKIKLKWIVWWRWLFFHCSYCLCKCDAPGPTSDRYWSLKPATSNIKKNFIVTGARFVKKSRVLHIEIEQAKALPEGGI